MPLSFEDRHTPANIWRALPQQVREAWLKYTHHYPRGVAHIQQVAEEARKRQDHQTAKLLEAELCVLRERRRLILQGRNRRKREKRQVEKAQRACLICGKVIPIAARTDRKTCGPACRKKLSRRSVQ